MFCLDYFFKLLRELENPKCQLKRKQINSNSEVALYALLVITKREQLATLQ